MLTGHIVHFYTSWLLIPSMSPFFINLSLIYKIDKNKKKKNPLPSSSKLVPSTSHPPPSLPPSKVFKVISDMDEDPVDPPVYTFSYKPKNNFSSKNQEKSAKYEYTSFRHFPVKFNIVWFKTMQNYVEQCWITLNRCWMGLNGVEQFIIYKYTS